VSEALRTLRASILLSSADHPPRIVMVSSAAQAEGKTTIVSNLAAILTQGGYRVALIDGDLRLSGLTKIFSESLGETTVGLTDLLTGQTSLEQALRTTSVPGLDIIPAGNQAPDPAELLGSQRMRELTRGLTQRYDFVLIDSPPILPVADSLMLSRVVDSVVMVVRSTHTDRKQAQEARRRLIAVPARILGLVLNDVELGAGGGRGYYGY
jgi:capsular exopolysaccharide synthesis family protein